mgnify:CR=1 FL=1
MRGNRTTTSRSGHALLRSRCSTAAAARELRGLGATGLQALLRRAWCLCLLHVGLRSWQPGTYKEAGDLIADARDHGIEQLERLQLVYEERVLLLYARVLHVAAQVAGAQRGEVARRR